MPELSFINKLKVYTRFFIITIAVLAFDQISKYWILASVPEHTYFYPEPISIVDGFLYIVHIHNGGAVWGLFKGYSYLLGIFALVVLALIYFFRNSIGLNHTIVQYSFGLLTGGIIGNLIDRFQYNYVIDFIDVHLPWYRWPAFNVADIGITVGVFMYLIYSLFLEEKSK